MPVDDEPKPNRNQPSPALAIMAYASRRRETLPGHCTMIAGKTAENKAAGETSASGHPWKKFGEKLSPKSKIFF